MIRARAAEDLESEKTTYLRYPVFRSVTNSAYDTSAADGNASYHLHIAFLDITGNFKPPSLQYFVIFNFLLSVKLQYYLNFQVLSKIYTSD
jgi:hypothetical protein